MVDPLLLDYLKDGFWKTPNIWVVIVAVIISILMIAAFVITDGRCFERICFCCSCNCFLCRARPNMDEDNSSRSVISSLLGEAFPEFLTGESIEDEMVESLRDKLEPYTKASSIFDFIVQSRVVLYWSQYDHIV